MAVAPGTYDITLQRRADHVLQLQFKDSTNAPINLTGWTAAAQVWDEGRTTKYADFTVSYVNRTLGQVKLMLGTAQTTIIPDRAYYDVLLTNPSGLKEYYLEGVINVSEGYTA
jgi:hypothetical protein